MWSSSIGFFFGGGGAIKWSLGAKKTFIWNWDLDEPLLSGQLVWHWPYWLTLPIHVSREWAHEPFGWTSTFSKN
jgi:hypothetical protein